MKSSEGDDDIPVLSTDNDNVTDIQKRPKTRKKASERKPLTRIKLKFPTSSGIACTEPCAHPRCVKTCKFELDQPHDSHY